MLALATLIIVGKALIAAAIGFLFPYPARTALVVAAGLSQIGEFSFIVGQAGVSLGLLDPTQYSLILAGAIVSITVNPFMFRLIEPIESALQRRPDLWRWINRDGHRAQSPPEEALRGHVVIVGSGRVGRHLAEILGTLDVPRLVIDSDWSRIEALTESRVPTLYGDAASSTLLEHAGLPRARALVVTVPDETVAAIIVAAGRDIAPDIPVIARAGTDQGAKHLSELGAGSLVRPEFEGGLQILRSALLALGFPSRRIQEFVDQIRGREVFGGHVENELSLVRKLAASDLELDWMTVSVHSAVSGQTIASASLRERTGVSIVASEHRGTLTVNPGPGVELGGGDRIAVIGRPDSLVAAAAPARRRHSTLNRPRISEPTRLTRTGQTGTGGARLEPLIESVRTVSNRFCI